MLLSKIRFLLICLALVHLTIKLGGQELALRQFTHEDGLPSLTLYKVMELLNGDLCITTTKGICSFNGKHFKKYNIRGLKSFDTPFSFIDKEGNPWFYNMAGEIFYIHADSLIKLNLEDYKKGDKIYSLYVANPYLYITWSSFNGQSSYRYNLNNLNECTVLNRRYIFTGLVDGELYAYDLDQRKSKMVLYRVEGNEICGIYPIQRDDKMDLIYEFDHLRVTKNCDVLMVNSNYIRLLSRNFEQKKSIYFPSIIGKRITYISIINDDEIFFNTYGESFIYNHLSGRLQKSAYPMDYINDVYEDRYNRRWLTTNGHGLFLDLRNGAKVFNTSNSQLASNDISSIELLDSTMYLCHNNGQITSIQDGQLRILPLGVISGRVRFIRTLSNHKMLIGHDQRLTLLDNRRLTVCDDLRIGGLKAIWQLSDDQTLFCTSLGVYRMKWKTGLPFKCHEIQLEREFIERSNCINTLKHDVFIGTSTGVYKRDTGGIWTRMLARSLYVNKMINQGDSVLWICTDGEGIFCFNGMELTDSISSRGGLVSDNVTSMTFDPAGRKYIATDNGISVFYSHHQKHFSINHLDGLPGNEVTDVKLFNGMLWAATPMGLYSVPLESVNPNQEVPFLRVQKIEVFDQTGKKEFGSNLKYNENHLRFLLGGRSLISGDEYRIWYQLEGQTQWTEVHDEVLDFIGLTPGKYQVKFKGIHEDQVESEIVGQHFTIEEAFWKTRTFNAAIAFLLIASSIVLTYYRARQVRSQERKEQRIKDQINMLREEALQSQMNPHFIFNALNAIQSYLSTSDQSNAMNYLSKFGKLIRMIFEQSRLKRVSLEDEISFLKNYLELEKMRFRDKIEVHLDITKEVTDKAAEIQIPPLIIQPMIENAFKHGLLHKGSGARLNIQMELIQDQLLCTIEDNGIGRTASEKINAWKSKWRKSSGIKSTLERLALLDQGKNKIGLEIIDLKDDNGNAMGTKAIIKL